MDPDSGYQLILLIVLIMFSAVFTAAAAAFQAVSRYKLRHLIAEFNPGVTLVNKLLEQPVRLNNTILIGDNLCNISAVAIGTAMAFHSWGEERGFFIAIILLTFLVIVFGEILPQTIANKNPEKTAVLVVRIIYALMIILFPVVAVLNQVSHFFSWVLGVKENSHDNGSITEEEIINMVAAGQEDGIIHQEEKTMIHGVFDFTDTIVRDVMIPRPDIVAIEKDAPLDDLLKIIKEEQFSRIPVYQDTIDNILGIVHIKDLIVGFAGGDKEFALSEYLRQPFYVPETKKVNELFKAMKKEKSHMAVVLDEYGSTAGLVTMEDLIEEIMGDIQDEHDTEEPDVQRIDADTIEFNASIRLDELNEQMGLNLECDEADTVGGLVFTLLDRVPVEGDEVEVKGVRLIVLDMDGHRIEKIRLVKQNSEQDEDPAH